MTAALVALWTDYAGVSPTDAHTHIDGNTVTCVMVDGVSDFNIATDRTLDGYQPHGVASTLADYKLEAISEVTRVTHQRVTSFLSSHDADTDVATETFTLEASLSRGAPRDSTSARSFNPVVKPRFSSGDRVTTTEPYRGLASGLTAKVVSVDAGSGTVTVAPPTDEPRSVFLSVDASSLRHLRNPGAEPASCAQVSEGKCR